MAKHRTHEVRQKERKSHLHCGTITQEDILTMERAGRRQRQIDSGVSLASGTGVHGGGKRERNRKDRRDSRKQTRDWSE